MGRGGGVLSISQGTQQALSIPHEETYVRRIVAQMLLHFPKHARALGQQGTETAVRALIARGRGHQISSEYHLYQFACLGFALGAEFDTDPKLPWVASTLKSRILGNPGERMEQVYDLALAALQQTGRPVMPLPVEPR